MTRSPGPLCQTQPSPPANITLHANFKAENKLTVVVCQWKQGLIQLLTERITQFMQEQLWVFYGSTFLFNLVVFLVFLFFFERKLRFSLTRPI